ncbi:hypothetical protein [Sphingobacterium siyangense]|uniref:hypothetical protein n=1 Tax=Sphingobacterium siyangense TaxID=459529 RepID=UPI002FDA54DD
MKYEIKLTAFLDILGFGSLVESSADDPGLTATIYEVLSSINKERVHKEAYLEVNWDIIPEEEIENVKRDAELFTQVVAQEWPITVSYFSDSLVLSAENSNACYSILEAIARLYIRIWDEYKLLLRGGISIGKLIHEDNGPIFGPAMNQAYYLESKYAVNPRVIIDKKSFTMLTRVDLYKTMNNIFDNGTDYISINLATAYNHLINYCPGSLVPGIKEKYIQSLKDTPAALDQKLAQYQLNPSVCAKYEWVKGEINALLETAKF